MTECVHLVSNKGTGREHKESRERLDLTQFGIACAALLSVHQTSRYSCLLPLTYRNLYVICFSCTELLRKSIYYFRVVLFYGLSLLLRFRALGRTLCVGTFLARFGGNASGCFGGTMSRSTFFSGTDTCIVHVVRFCASLPPLFTGSFNCFTQ